MNFKVEGKNVNILFTQTNMFEKFNEKIPGIDSHLYVQIDRHIIQLYVCACPVYANLNDCEQMVEP